VRPTYHYTPAANWLSDPNGLVFADGEWHLFYQYNPHGEQWGHMAWGHAVSRDLVAWEELAPALLEDDGHQIFSGSAVVDAAGVAGFGEGALVAAYTGAAHDGSRQVQCLAHSNDSGRSWTKYPGNPILDRGIADFRDPNIFWHGPSTQWIMVVALSAEDRALVYGSRDLKAWTELSSIGPHLGCGRVWECPLLIELPVEGESESRWLFKVDLLHDGPGSGAIGVIGSFDGRDFVAEGNWRLLDQGRDFYAAIGWHEPRDNAGRPAWIGWIGNHSYQAALPMRGWRGAMSLPKRLSLRRAPDGGLVVVQSVDDAVISLLGDRRAIIAGDQRVAWASRMTIEAGRWSLALIDDAGDSVTIESDGTGLSLCRAAGISPAYDAVIALGAFGGRATRLWLDGSTLELEADEGASWASFQHLLTSRTLTLRFATDSGVAAHVSEMPQSNGLAPG